MIKEGDWRVVINGTKYVPQGSSEDEGTSFSQQKISSDGKTASVFIAGVSSFTVISDTHIQLYNSATGTTDKVKAYKDPLTGIYYDDESGKFTNEYCKTCGTTPAIPIDGGISFLLAAGLGYVT